MSNNICDQHADIVDRLMDISQETGKQSGHLETLISGQAELFRRMNEIKSALDVHTTKAMAMCDDVANLQEIAQDNRDKITGIKRTVENGLTEKVSSLHANMEQLKSNTRQGTAASITDAVIWFRSRFWQITIVGAFFFILWATSKAVFFQKGSLFDTLLHSTGVPH